MELKSPLSRRALVAGVTVLAAGPVLAATSAMTGTTPIARLWAEAQKIGTALAGHRDSIAKAASLTGDGVPGWMRLGGQANALAEARYGTLIAILNETPKTAGDLAIIGKVSMDGDITSGARAWASERLAVAAVTLAA